MFDIYYSDFFREYWGYLAAYFGVSVILLLLQNILAPRNYSKLSTDTGEHFTAIFRVIVILWTIILACYFAKSKIEEVMLPQYAKMIRNKIVVNTFEKYKNNIIDIKIGDYLERISRVSGYLIDALSSAFSTVFPSMIGMVLIILYISSIYLYAGLLLIFSVICIVFICIWMTPTIISVSNDRNEYYYSNIDKLNNKFNNLINIYLNNSEKEEIADYLADQETYTNLYEGQIKETNYMVNIMQAITIVSFLITVYICHTHYKELKMTKEQFVAIIFIMTYFMMMMRSLTTHIPYVVQQLGVAKNSEKYFRDILTFRHPVKKVVAPFQLREGVEFRDVSFYYPTDDRTSHPKYILRHFDLTVRAGEKVAILGGSGSGKSTLSKLLLNLYSYEGDILLDSVNTKDIDNNVLRAMVVYINQRTQMFDTTVLENIKYGNPGVSDQDVMDVLQAYHLDSIYKGLQDGVHSQCGLNGNHLSLGMQKVTMLLRAYFKIADAQVVVFDEPLAGLDGDTRKKIMKMISGIPTSKTVMVITHDREILEITDREVNLKPIAGAPGADTTVPTAATPTPPRSSGTNINPVWSSLPITSQTKLYK
jgi:ABC-type multidrug transport system fused ATPase/permease subunit